MSEMATISQAELDRLHQRVRKLASDKSYLQLVIRVMNRISEASGLDNMVQGMLKGLMDVIGATNIILYYWIDDALYYADVFDKQMLIERLDDAMAQKVLTTREPLVCERPFAETQMLTPEFAKGYTWVFPLLVGSELIGIFRMENLHLDMRDLYGQLPALFRYLALVLRNEILGQTRLKQAYDRIREAHAELVKEIGVREQAETALQAAKEELELRVQERTEELRIANDNLTKDIAQRKRAEAELARANRSLRILSHCNEAIIRDYEETSLLDEVCQSIVEIGGHRLVWVGWAEQEEAKTVRPAAHAGDETGYRRLSRVTWADSPGGDDPTAIAIRTGIPCRIRDISRHASEAPWRNKALACGYYSVVALPLSSEGRVFGSLTVFASEPNVFDDRELGILNELAGDLSLGITLRRTRKAHKLAEERIKLLAAIVESSDDAIIGKDLDGRIISWNKGAEEIYGYTAAEIEGRLVSILVPSDRQEELADIMTRLKRGERVEHQESVRIRKDGQEINVSFTISPIRDANGRVVGASIITRDVTERKRLEEALRRSETKHRIVADQTYDFEFWLNPEGEYVYASPSCERITGYTAEQYLNDPGLRRRIIHPDDLEIFDRHISEEEKQHKTCEVEWRITHADGSVRWIAHVCRPIFSEQGDYLGVRGSNRDNTERKLAEEALRERKEVLERFEKVVIGRELKMRELKKQVADLEQAVNDRKGNRCES